MGLCISQPKADSWKEAQSHLKDIVHTDKIVAMRDRRGTHAYPFLVDNTKFWKVCLRKQVNHSRRTRRITMAQHFIPDDDYVVHPTRVVSLREAILLEFQWFGDGDLYNFIHSDAVASVKTVNAILKYTARCIQYVHSRGRVHLDIKPENILLLGTETRLCDLEFSNSGEPFRMRGTPLYIPQLCVCKRWYERVDIADAERSRRLDIYAFGKTILIVLYQCLSWQVLSKTQEELLEKMRIWAYDEVGMKQIVWATRRMAFSNITQWYEIGIRCCVDNHLDMMGFTPDHGIPTMDEIMKLVT